MQQHKSKDEPLWKITKGYKQEYTPDVEKGLRALKGKIAKSESPATVIPLRYWLTRAASIAIIVLGGIFLYQQLPTETLTAVKVLQSNEAVVSTHQLPDGTQLWLNKGSQLTHPALFSASERIVHLEGEAYLQVISDPLKPFIIKTKEASIEVLGTAFSVKSYPAEETTIVSVEEGKVSFTAIPTGKNLILQAQEKGTYQKNQKELVKSTTTPIEYLAWKEEKLIFDNTSIAEIINYLYRQFDVEVSTTMQLTDCGLTATLVDNNPTAILKQIALSFPIEVEQIEDKKYKLEGKCE